MRLPSESKQQLFLKNMFRENCLLNSGLGMVLAVIATVNAEQAFFVGGIALLLILFNSFTASVLADVFRLRLPLWARVLATALLVSALSLAFAQRMNRLPPMTSIAVFILSVSPLAYARSLAFADGATPGRSLFDAAGAGIGFISALMIIGLAREALGSGTLGSISLFNAAPLPIAQETFGGFLATAAAVVAFRMIFARPAS